MVFGVSIKTDFQADLDCAKLKRRINQFGPSSVTSLVRFADGPSIPHCNASLFATLSEHRHLDITPKTPARRINDTTHLFGSSVDIDNRASSSSCGRPWSIFGPKPPAPVHSLAHTHALCFKTWNRQDNSSDFTPLVSNRVERILRRREADPTGLKAL